MDNTQELIEQTKNLMTFDSTFVSRETLEAILK